MRKNFKYFVCFVFVIFLFTTCKKEDPVRQPGTFFMTIDKWVHWNYSTSDILYSQFGYLLIYLNNHVEPYYGVRQLTISIDNFDSLGIGEYPLSNLVASEASYAMLGFETNQSYSIYSTTDSCLGKLRITKFNRSTKKISGTFYFEAASFSAVDGSYKWDHSKRISITEGHFDDAEFN